MNIIKKLPAKKKLLISAAALILVLALVLMLLPRREAMPQSSVNVVKELITGTAETGSITETFVSGGTIASVGARPVSLAGSVKLTGWAVSSGDYVEAGDLLATVDKSSVLSAISDLNELMATLDSAIESSRSDAVSSAIYAPAPGRVKAVFVESGESVTDAMYENSALMLLSLDGRMAVDIDAGDMSPGTALTVTLSDGTELSGSVYSISEGTAAVTVPDTAAEYGDTVTVSYDGDVIGAGTLRINNPLRVVGYAGTVSSVSVSAGAYVYSGQQLLTLTDTGYSARYETLLEKRRTLETQMQELFKAYETGGVYAASSGCVSELNEDIVTETNTVYASAAAYSGGSGGIKLLSSISHIGRRAVLLSSESPDTGIQDSETPSPAPSGEPSPSPSPSPEPGESTEYIGKVTDIKENEDGTRTVTVALTDGSRIELDSAQLGEKAAGIKTGDILALEYSPSGELINVTVYQNGSGGNTPGGQDGMPGGSGGMSGGMGGGSGAAMNGAQEAESDPDYIMEEAELCTLTPYDTAEISLTVDELDISRLSIGQPVTVTLDALPGQSFDGSITLIDPNGSSAGGDTKYTVTVSIARTQDMLEGMNASVTAELACHDGLLLIPAAALYEDAGGTYVYTGTDKNGEPSGPVAVTTGLSDGTNVEITGGLSDGDSFCYLYSSALEYTFT